MNKRQSLQRSAASLAFAGLPFPGLFLRRAQAVPAKPLGQAQPFDFALLKGRAQSLAALPCKAPVAVQRARDATNRGFAAPALGSGGAFTRAGSDRPLVVRVAARLATGAAAVAQPACLR